MDSTLNFSAREFRCKCPKCNKEVPHKMEKSVMEKVQKLRELYGGPLTLTSAYRCAEHPEEAKKTKPGQHNKGKAVDIAITDGAMGYKLVKLGLELGATGVGVAKTFVHLDWRSETPVIFIY